MQLGNKASVFNKLAMLLAAVAVGSSAYATTNVSASGTSSFLVQNSKSALLKPGKLVMQHVSPDTLWFANAPSTATGYYSLNKYMDLWATPTAPFAQEKPNATLIGYFSDPKTHQEKRMAVVVTLHNATLSADKDNIVYNVTKSLLVPDKKSFNAQVVLTHPTLLIDVLPTGGQGGYGPG